MVATSILGEGVGAWSPMRDNYRLAQMLVCLVMVELALAIVLGAAWVYLDGVAARWSHSCVATVLSDVLGWRWRLTRTSLAWGLKTDALVHAVPANLPYLWLCFLHGILWRGVLVHRHELLGAYAI